MKSAKGLKPPKPLGTNREAHTANTKYGMGNSYGSGVKQKLGKIREGMGMIPVSKKKMAKPPSSLA
jgi:hypothetical protein